MNPHDITAALRKAGTSQAKIARKLHVAPATVSDVVHNYIRSRRIALEIARQSGSSIQVMWPGVYDAARQRRQAPTRKAA